ncbi:xylose isomerase-like protein [Sarocladium strictum]
MRRLGELAHLHGITVAFEAVAWGIHLNKWQHIHDVLKEVRLPNVRYCLDTFHIAGVEAGDPFNKEKPVRNDGLERLERSLKELRETVKAEEIGYFQLSDAIPADKEQRGYPVRDLEQPPFMTQSRNCRVFPGEGSLPVLPVAKAVFDTGYRGWVSMEVFHPDLWSKDKM